MHHTNLIILCTPVLVDLQSISAQIASKGRLHALRMANQSLAKNQLPSKIETQTYLYTTPVWYCNSPRLGNCPSKTGKELVWTWSKAQNTWRQNKQICCAGLGRWGDGSLQSKVYHASTLWKIWIRLMFFTMSLHMLPLWPSGFRPTPRPLFGRVGPPTTNWNKCSVMLRVYTVFPKQCGRT